MMTTIEFNAIQTRIDLLGKETRDELRATRDQMTTLAGELASTRAALASCQSRCWVGEDGRKETRKFLYSVLAAVGASWLINWFQHLGR